jgi:hypothetical protein
LQRLCRYIARPAVSTQRLSLTRNGQVRYELKTPYRNGTTHVDEKAASVATGMLPQCRAPPPTGLFV